MGSEQRRSAFPYGVASGDPSTSEVTLWTRVADDVVPGGGRASVDWWIEERAGGGRIRSGTETAVDGFVRIRVDDLPSGRELEYGFAADGRRSPTGRTRTLERAPSRSTIAVVCCGRWPDGDFHLYRRVAEAEPDLVLHLGDYIYEDGDGGPRGPHSPSRPCHTADDYERRYRQYRSDPDLQALHRAAPWIAIWDDHEFANDAWRTGAPTSRTDEAWQRRRRAGAAAFHRWMPQRPHGNGPTSVDRSVALGPLGDVVLVDARMAGRERPAGGADGPAVADPTSDRRLLTPA